MATDPRTTERSARRRRAEQRLLAITNEKHEPVFRRLAILCDALFRRISAFRVDHPERLPRTGGVLIVANHISYADPVALGVFLIRHGRWPRYLGKAVLWRIPVIGWLARNCGQIPVERGTKRASDALVAAGAALDAGRCVVIYPEGTVTRDPDMWPMVPKSGAARLALATGVPVVPVAQWGAQQIMPGVGPAWPRLGRGKVLTFSVGEPVPLDDLRVERPSSREAVAAASERIVDALTALLVQVRGETPPPGRWHRASGRRI